MANEEAVIAMDIETQKCVLVVDEGLPLGVIANTAAVLAISLGKLRPQMVGADLKDHDEWVHQGITTIPIPILKGNAELLKRMRSQLKDLEPELLVVDVISATRTTKSYEEYAAALERVTANEIEYLGLGLYGHRKTVNKFTGSLGLLR